MPIRVENFPSTDVCLGYQVNLTISSATALSAPAFAKWMLLTVENASLRYRCDGTSPTVSQGVLMQAGQTRAIGLSDFTKFKAIQVGSGSTITVEYWGEYTP